jgi:transposase
VYVLESGCSWRKLPGSFPVHWRTAHRRFAEWVAAGVMTALHHAMLDVLGVAGQIDWSRASIDSMHVRALKRWHVMGPPRRGRTIEVRQTGARGGPNGYRRRL